MNGTGSEYVWMCVDREGNNEKRGSLEEKWKEGIDNRG